MAPGSDAQARFSGWCWICVSRPSTVYLKLFRRWPECLSQASKVQFIFPLCVALRTVFLHGCFAMPNLHSHLRQDGRCILFSYGRKRNLGPRFVLKMPVFVCRQVLIFLKMSLTLKDSQEAAPYQNLGFRLQTCLASSLLRFKFSWNYFKYLCRSTDELTSLLLITTR